MRHVTVAGPVKAAAVVALVVCASLPAQAQTRAAGEKISSEQFEQKLQDTRDLIKKQTTTAPQGNQAHPFAVDICKKNPNLPQCKL